MKAIIAVPAIVALVYRAYSRNSLTPIGILFAFLTAVVHAIHPWSVFFFLLTTFFLAGTFITKIKHDVKARLTQSSSGGSGAEGPRNHFQVLANSIVATVLISLHAWSLRDEKDGVCFRGVSAKRASDVLVVGIVA